MRSIGRSPASSMTIKWSPNCISGPFAILEQEDSILQQGEDILGNSLLFRTKFFLQIVIAPKCLLKPSKMSFNQIGILYDWLFDVDLFECYIETIEMQ